MHRFAVLLLLAACGDPRADPRPAPPPRSAPETAHHTVPPATATDVDAVFEDVRALADQSDFAAALVVAEAAMPADEIGRARIQALRAYLLARLGQPQSALALAHTSLADLQRLKASPLHLLEANTAVGNIYWSLGEFERARAAYETALVLDVGDAPAVRSQRGRLLFNVAMIHAGSGRFAEAVGPAKRGLAEELAGGVAACPGLSQTRAQLATVLGRLDRHDEATAVLDEARRGCAETPGMEVPRAQLDLTRADVLRSRGLHEAAGQACRDAAAVFGRRPEQARAYARAILCETDALRQLGRFGDAVVAISAPIPGLDRAVPEEQGLRFAICTSKVRSLLGAKRHDDAQKQLSECASVALALPDASRSIALGESERLASALQR